LKRKKFTDQEKQILLKNENILGISDTNIKYCPKFKTKAVKEYYQGNSPMKIFLNAKIDIDILGRENPERCLSRWKQTYKKLGKKGLLDETRGRGKGGGRPRTRELTLEEKVKFLETRNAYLEAENDFLKKLKALRGGLI
jgi:transposase